MSELYQFHRLEHIQSSEQMHTALAVAIVECIREAFGEAPDDTADHLNGDEILLTTQYGVDKILAYYSAFHEISPQQFFHDEDMPQDTGSYISAVTVDGGHHGKGISKELYRQSLLPKVEQRLPMLFTRTQNPRVEAGITGFLRQAVKDKLLSGFQLERKLMKGVYGQMLTTTQPESNNLDAQEHYVAIDQSAGDAYVLIFRLQYDQEEAS